MKLKTLIIDRMPGFEHGGFRFDDLAPGLNVVVGRNGSGKSTVCRAVRGLLCPGYLSADRIAPVALTGLWQDGDSDVRLHIEGKHVRCTRAGRDAEWPVRFAPQEIEAFTVAGEQLFASTDTDTAIVERLAREMAGGYDIAAIRAALKQPATRGRKEADALRRAETRVREVSAGQEQLQREADRLAALARLETAAQAAQRRVQDIADAAERGARLRQMADCDCRLAAFPPGIERLSGNERELAVRLVREQRRWTEQVQAAGAALEDGDRRLAEIALPTGGVPEDRLRTQRATLEELRRVEADARECTERLVDIEGRLQAAHRALSGGARAADAGEPVPIGAAELAQIETFQRDYERVSADLEARRAECRALEDAATAPDPESLKSGVDLLRAWLDAAAALAVAGAGSTGNAVPWPALALAAMMLAGGVGLGLTVSWWWGGALVVAALALAGIVGTPRQEGGRAADSRPECQKRFVDLGLTPPATWGVADVTRTLTELTLAWDRARLAAERSQRRAACAAVCQEFAARRAALDERRRELATRLGAAPDAAPLALMHLAQRLDVVARLEVERAGLVAARAGAAARRCAVLEPLNALFAEFGMTPVADSATGAARLDDLAERSRDLATARKDIEAAHRQQRAAAAGLQAVVAEKREIAGRIGFSIDDVAELEQRLDLLEVHRKTVQERKVLAAQCEALEQRLASAPELLELDAADLEKARIEAESLAEKWRDTVEEIARINRDIEHAKAGHDLEQALAEKRVARAALTAAREDVLHASLGLFLLDDVAAEHQVSSQPVVARAAEHWFGRFTRQRYGLRIEPANDGQPVFHALDNEDAGARRLALHELSSGTRMQLLLAVRLAFAVSLEGGRPVPFVLDEVLNNTDPERFQAVAEGVLEMVRAGRQVFYLTCRPGDARVWQALAEARGTTVNEIDLDAVRGRAAARRTPWPEPDAAQTRAVPPPAGRSLDAYAMALAVPRLDASAGAAAAHVSYLVDTPDTLHRLLQAGIDTFGRVASLVRHGAAAALVPEQELARMQARAALLDGFAAAYRIGRGTLLTPEILAESGVTAVFLERVVALARDHDWRADKLIAALEKKDDERAKGFRNQALETLRTALTEGGYLPEAPVLDADALYARTLAAAAEPLARTILSPAEARQFVAAILP